MALVLLAFVVLGPAILPHDAAAQNLTAQLEGPSGDHLLGTDQFGRDVLARISEGGRRSVLGALAVMATVFIIGLGVGVASGVARRSIDNVVMRLIDVLLGMPSLIVAIALVGALGPSFTNLLIALTVSTWPYYARLARGFTIHSAERLDVIAARLAGVGRLRVVGGHIVPGVASQLLVIATLDLGHMIVSLAGLSFLGLGAQPPTPEWGVLVMDGQDFFAVAPWLLIAPTVCIAWTVTAANLIGEATRGAEAPAAR